MVSRATRAIPGLPTPPGFRRVAGNWVPEPIQCRGRRLGAFGGFAASRRAAGSVVAASGSAPTVTSISPESGPAETFVTITGTDFVESGLVVTVGGVALTSPTVVNSTTIRGYTDTHADGAVDVYVETTYGNDTLVEGYTYASGGGAAADLFDINFDDTDWHNTSHDGGFTNWSGYGNDPDGTVRFTQAVVDTGRSWSAEFYWAGTGSQESSHWLWRTEDVIAGINPVWIRIRYYITAWPDGVGFKLCPRMKNTSNANAFGLQSYPDTGKLVVVTPAAGSYYIGGEFATNEWVTVEQMYDCENWTWALRINGVNAITEFTHLSGEESSYDSETGLVTFGSGGGGTWPGIVDMPALINGSDIGGSLYVGGIKMGSQGWMGA